MPPVELWDDTQLFVPALKFSESSIDGAQVRLEDEVRLNGKPGQTWAVFAPALTLGIGSTVTIIE